MLENSLVETFESFVKNYYNETLKPDIYNIHKLNLGGSLYPYDLILIKPYFDDKVKYPPLYVCEGNPKYTKKPYVVFINENGFNSLNTTDRKYLFPVITTYSKDLLPAKIKHMEFDTGLLSDRLSIFINCVILDDNLEKLTPSSYSIRYNSIANKLKQFCNYDGESLINESPFLSV